MKTTNSSTNSPASAAAALLGSAKSPAKAASSRQNGRKGGRPSAAIRRAATARLDAIAMRATATHPDSHHLRVRTNLGTYHAALEEFGRRLEPSQLSWETDISERLAPQHNAMVTLHMERARAALCRAIDKEMAEGRPVEIRAKVGDQWVAVAE